MSSRHSFTVDPSSSEDRADIPLSVPHLEGSELSAIQAAFESNWLGPIGPEVAAFEAEFADALGVPYALATTSGTAAIHLGLRVLGVGAGDEVLVSTLTFCASVNPIIYLGARPVFVDAERVSWNLDPELVADELDRRGAESRLPAAVVAVHLFGQVADMTPLLDACARWEVPLVEDAAEALGANHDAGTAGSLGGVGAFSFDASKMITTSMGGMLVSGRSDLIEHARKLARQAREPVAHYEHVELGYNYRMSNLLAAMGRVQLSALPDRVAARRRVHDWYATRLADVEGVEVQPEAPWGSHARWLTCVLLEPGAATGREALRLALSDDGIETRPLWKPMHLQPVYREMGFEAIGGAVAEDLFGRGLCLPSSSSMTEAAVERVCSVLGGAIRGG